MPRGNALTEIEKGKALAFKETGLSMRAIAKKINRSYNVIYNFFSDSENYGKKPKSGRPQVLSEKAKRRVVREASNKFISLAKIKSNLKLKASRSTIFRVLKANPNIKFMKPKRKPKLKQAHKEARLEWAKEHMQWKDEWQKVIMSDEKKMNLDGPDGFSYYWHDLRKEPVIMSKRNFGGGGVMFWAAFGMHGASPIVFIDGRMNAFQYQEMLQQHLLPIGVDLGGPDWIFQQDRASIHNAHSTSAFFRANNVRVLDWAACSPDLNLIENLWGLLARNVYANGRQYNSINELKQEIQKCWTEIAINDHEMRRRLIDSMKNRIFEVIRANGGATKY